MSQGTCNRWQFTAGATAVALLLALARAALPQAAAAAAPAANLAPAPGTNLNTLGPTLSWTNPVGTTQVHVQVIPALNDGPGVDVTLDGPVSSFRLPAPPEWYGLLPGMSYTWRVRTSDAPAAVGLSDPSWSPWTGSGFRTPAVDSATVTLVAPAPGTTEVVLNPTLRWSNTRSDVFYYEVQLSKDATFNTNPATATAMVYSALIHGGASTPPNSYDVPNAAVLEPGIRYHWRVRPRVQGDGTPVAWPEAASFTTSLAGVVTPRISPTATPTPVPPPPTPTATPDPQAAMRLAFISTRDAGDHEVYVTRSDGAGLVRVTNRQGLDSRPAWSPSAASIAFLSRAAGSAFQEILLTGPEGGSQPWVVCCGPGDDFSWSPDGKKLAFSRDGNIEIVDVTDRGAPRVISPASGQGRASPSWSPDGTRLAFEVWWSGVAGSGNRSDIFVTRIDGGNTVELTSSDGIKRRPVWSPAGDRLLFSSTTDGNEEIYTVRPDGSRLTRITSNAGADRNPAWSPDGKRIVFSAVRLGDEDIWVMDDNGANQTNLTNAPGPDTNPAWSPDGNRVAFQSMRDGNWEVYVVRSSGGPATNLTNSPGHDMWPAWAPR